MPPPLVHVAPSKKSANKALVSVPQDLLSNKECKTLLDVQSVLEEEKCVMQTQAAAGQVAQHMAGAWQGLAEIVCKAPKLIGISNLTASVKSPEPPPPKVWTRLSNKWQ